MTTKTYTDIEYSNMACKANDEGKKLITIQREEKVPIYDEEGQIIDYNIVVYEDLAIVDFAEEEKREQLNLLSLTKREVFLALYKEKGITPEQLRAQIQSVEAQIEFDYAEKYFRGNPLIDGIGTALGYSQEELDNLFLYKDFKKPELEPEPTPEPTEEPTVEQTTEPTEEPTEEPQPEPEPQEEE